MSKSAEDMQSLMDNPDSLDMDDEEAILALANGAELPDEADDQVAIDLGKTESVKQSASDSADVDKNTDGLSDDDIKAPVESKDGKHTIPYNVLDNTRKSLKTANDQLSTVNTALEDQKAENRRLQAMFDKAQQGEHVADKDLEAEIDTKSTASTAEEEFVIKNGMSSTEFQKEYGAALTKSLLLQAGESLEMRQQLGVLMEDRNLKVETEESTIAETLQGAIDNIPELAALQAVGGEKWQEAVDTDNAIRQMPKYRNADFATRFNAVAKEMGLIVAGKPSASNKKTEVIDTDDQLPTSISDLPGGSPASQSARQTVESMDAADMGIAFANMTQKQQDDYLNNL